MQKIEVLMATKNHGAVIDSFFIDKIVEVSTKELSDVINNMYGDYDFISAHQDSMYVDDKGNNHAILLKTKNCIDGFVIMDADPERQIGYVQDAAHLQVMEVYPSLHLYQREMVSLVDKAVERSLAGQTEGSYYFKLYDYASQCRGGNFNDGLFAEMLMDRPEIAGVDYDVEDGMAYVDISDEFRTVENNDNLREITKEEFDVICAKHTLWFHDAGGEQADFSNCLLKGMSLYRKELPNAIFNGAKIVDCDFSRSMLLCSEFKNAVFYNVQMIDTDIKSSDFSGAVFKRCEQPRMDASDCNFANASFYDCNMYGAEFEGSCIQGITRENCADESIRDYDCYDNLEEWQAVQDGSAITM